MGAQAKVYGRPVGWVPLDQVSEVLGVTPKRAKRLVCRGPLLGAWKSGELMVAEEDLVLFVAEQRRW